MLLLWRASANMGMHGAWAILHELAGEAANRPLALHELDAGRAGKTG